MDDKRRFTVTPTSTDPKDIADALLAEKLANSPVAIAAFEKEFRRRIRVLTTGEYVEYWDQR
jgi:hypothetical protein